jgi:FkbM family methyltransferase
MTNVFLDLGTHLGQGLEHFIYELKIDDQWKVHTFEANPDTYKQFTEGVYNKYPFIVAHNKAVSNRDGMLQFNQETFPGEPTATGQASSTIDMSKWDPWGNNQSAQHFSSIEVSCIDFAKFIKDNFNEQDNIFIKMDIEGAEFDVLEKLYNEDLFRLINILAVEWHAHYFSNREEMEIKKQDLLSKLLDAKVNVLEWY